MPHPCRPGCLGRVALALLLSAVGACRATDRPPADGDGVSGQGGDGGGSGNGSGSSGDAGKAGGSGGQGGSAGTSAELRPTAYPLQRLSSRELTLTITDLLGDASRPPQLLAGEVVDPVTGFTYAGEVSQTVVASMQDIAETAATAATTPERLPTLLACQSQAAKDERACASTFIERFGRRAFRRPLTASETADFLTFYDGNRAAEGATFADAIRQLVTAFLMSPELNYHRERAPEDKPKLVDGSELLGPYELASRLSYLTWRSLPDDDLLRAAEEGRLADASRFGQEVDRVLTSPKAQDGWRNFLNQWLGLENVLAKDNGHPEWTTAVRQDVLEGAVAAFTDVVTKSDARLSSVLLNPVSYVSGLSAPLLGRSAQGSKLERVTLDGKQRAGLLTQPAFLALYTDPIRRGLAIRKRILCQQIAVPAKIPAPPSVGNVSTRERNNLHAANGGCATCHKLMDPLGFAFLHYDDIGRWRDTEGPYTIDATGVINGVDNPLTFDGAVELSKALVDTPETHACGARNILGFALGSAPSDEAVEALLTLTDGRSKDGFDLRRAIRAVATSPAFARRLVPSQETSR